MGGFFSPPSAPPLPTPLPPIDTGEEDRKRRVVAIERRRRGRDGTIATSARGVLAGPSSTSSSAIADILKDKLGD